MTLIASLLGFAGSSFAQSVEAEAEASEGEDGSGGSDRSGDSALGASGQGQGHGHGHESSSAETDGDAAVETDVDAAAAMGVEAAMAAEAAIAETVELPPRVPLLDPELTPEEPEVRPPLAAPGHGAPLHWNENWGHWGLADQINLGIMLGSTIAFQIVGPRRTGDDAWTGTTALDRTFRRGLAVNNIARRQRIRDASDVFLTLAVSWPLLFDGLASALWYHQSPKVARELALLSVETQFITASIQSLANILGSRRRPYVTDCGGLVDERDQECRGRVRFRSFFSGHTSQAFAGAATTCVFHARVPLYGGSGIEALPCVAMMTVAAATGLFRILGDMHWATDVITGAAVGITVGSLVPALRMRTWGDRTRVRIAPHGLGLALLGHY
ncbi:MAG: phosphatase PAP2 family protein [Myxococcota bacterium]